MILYLMERLLLNLKFLSSIKYSAFLSMSPHKGNILSYGGDFYYIFKVAFYAK